jgi:hypothetical protein
MINMAWNMTHDNNLLVVNLKYLQYNLLVPMGHWYQIFQQLSEKQSRPKFDGH